MLKEGESSTLQEQVTGYVLFITLSVTNSRQLKDPGGSHVKKAGMFVISLKGGNCSL